MRARRISYPDILAVGIQRLQAPASEDPYRKPEIAMVIASDRVQNTSQGLVLKAQANWCLKVPQGRRLRSQTRPVQTQVDMGVGQGDDDPHRQSSRRARAMSLSGDKLMQGES